MRAHLARAVAFAVLFGMGTPQAADPGTSWPSCTPASKGLNAAKLDELRIASGNLRGFIAKGGCRVFSWGSQTQKGDWASAAKPLISTMLFYAIKELKTSGVNARIVQYGWPMRVADESITWRHLANQTSGYTLPEGPGARWAYNDYAISIYCKTLFPRVFKQTMATVVANRLASLQFQDGGVIGGGRQGCQLYTSVRDAARIGQFWLNKGKWRGTQLLPASYFDNFRLNQVSATLPRTAGSAPDDYLGVSTFGGTNDQSFQLQGAYGYNWWLNQPKRLFPAAPVDTFLAIGHNFAEPIIVIPSLALVVTGKFRNSANFAAVLSDGNKYLRLLVEAHQ